MGEGWVTIGRSCHDSLVVPRKLDHGMMIDVRVRLGANGRIVIPADLRRRLGVEAGDELVLRVVDGELRVSTLTAAIDRAQRRLAPYLAGTPSLVDELIADRRRASERE